MVGLLTTVQRCCLVDRPHADFSGQTQKSGCRDMTFRFPFGSSFTSFQACTDRNRKEDNETSKKRKREVEIAVLRFNRQMLIIHFQEHTEL